MGMEAREAFIEKLRGRVAAAGAPSVCQRRRR